MIVEILAIGEGAHQVATSVVMQEITASVSRNRSALMIALGHQLGLSPEETRQADRRPRLKP